METTNLPNKIWPDCTVSGLESGSSLIGAAHHGNLPLSIAFLAIDLTLRQASATVLEQQYTRAFRHILSQRSALKNPHK